MVVVENNLKPEEEEKQILIDNTELEPGQNGKIVQSDVHINNDESIQNSGSNRSSQYEKDENIGVENSSVDKGNQIAGDKILDQFNH